MAVVAFVDGTNWTESVIDHAVWAATTLGQPLVIVARENVYDAEPLISYDAYEEMNAQDDMFRELSARPGTRSLESDAAAMELVQSAARRAKDQGVEKVRTRTTSESLPWYIENSTDSGDLLVIARHDGSESPSRQWLDQFLKLRSRVMLLVPERFGAIESWLIALDGKPATGRAVDFLTHQKLLQSKPGTAVIVGNNYEGRLHFRDAVRHLRSAGYTMKEHELQGHADDVLAAVLEVQPVDLLVMGAYGQGRFRLLTERSTTSRLLQTFRGPVLVARA